MPVFPPDKISNEEMEAITTFIDGLGGERQHIHSDAPTGLEAAYLECWHRVMEATARHGGGIAHHHGIGRIRRPYLVHDLGETGVTLLRTVHGAIDPKGLMNPGNLIPDA